MANKGILESIGGIAGGAIDVAGKVFSGTRLGSGIAANERAGQQLEFNQQNTEVSQLLAAIRATEDPKEKAGFLSQLKQTPTFQKFQVDMDAVAQAQANKKNGLKEAGDISIAASRLINAGFITEDDDTHKAMGVRAKEGIANFGITTPEEEPQIAGIEKLRLIDVWDENLSAFKKVSQKGIFKVTATNKESQAFADKFVADAQKGGASATSAKILARDLFKEERGKEGFGHDTVFKKGLRAADLFGFETPEGRPQDKDVSDDEVVKKFDDLVQTSTEGFPIDNTPKNFEALGITTTADQQQFQELEKAAPAQIDVQQFAQQSPEDFKRMLAMLRTGKTPGGKKFTIKDALKIMGNL